MNLVFLVIAVLCGIALLIELDTGSLEPFQVAGAGILSLAIAGLAPVIPWRS